MIWRLWACIPPWQTSAGAEKQPSSFTRQTPSSLPQSLLLPLVRLTLRPNPVPTSNYPRSRLFHLFILHALCLWPCESMTPNRALQRNFISVISFNSYHNLMKKVVFILPVLSIRKLKLKEKWRQWEKHGFHLGPIIPSLMLFLPQDILLDSSLRTVLWFKFWANDLQYYVKKTSFNILLKLSLRKYGQVWWVGYCKYNIKAMRGFPGGPVVKTPCFHSRGRGFDPWSN